MLIEGVILTEIKNIRIEKAKDLNMESMPILHLLSNNLRSGNLPEIIPLFILASRRVCRSLKETWILWQFCRDLSISGENMKNCRRDKVN